MMSQWRNFIFWIGAMLVIVLATVFYQPAAAKTGSLLVWTHNKVYVMDIDTLDLQRVGPATPNQSIAPSPGCFGQNNNTCWVLIDEALYHIDLSVGGSHTFRGSLPVGEGYQWANGQISWSPDGVHVAYSVQNRQTGRAELRVYDVSTNQIKMTDSEVNPNLAVAWTAACANSLSATNCEFGYQKVSAQVNDQIVSNLIGYAPATGARRTWPISPEPIFELRWSPEGNLLYSRPKRYFMKAEDNSPAYDLPAGAQLANMSPDARHAVYYQPFTLTGCQAEADDCLYLGVWLTQTGQVEAKPDLVYSLNLSEADQTGGLNFIPIWSPTSNAFVFFQEGRLIHYDLEKQEGTIWYQPVTGKLRSVPVFSPDGGALAFVDNQGQGFSDYRLVVVIPGLEPIEHIVQTNDGFKILAWLPN